MSCNIQAHTYSKKQVEVELRYLILQLSEYGTITLGTIEAPSASLSPGFSSCERLLEPARGTRARASVQLFYALASLRRVSPRIEGSSSTVGNVSPACTKNYPKLPRHLDTSLNLGHAWLFSTNSRLVSKLPATHSFQKRPLIKEHALNHN